MMSLRGPDRSLIPRGKGTYALLLHLDCQRLIQVGKLGAFHFPAGYYLYTGSAFGPGGLAGRLGRHLALDQATPSCHWHIDYLRHWAPIVAIWFCKHTTRREHDWTALAGQLAGATCPAPHFGASDCRCPAHLFHFRQAPSFERFSASLSRVFPSDGPLQALQISWEDQADNVES